ncbi:pentapeptide repeat-containing protein [Nostoc sp. FACHB-280]|uniref:pentapeptide repeat-containing protein n=1 Tax=Nostoc sp. FACHB-280 TaxID=2692839 RepID=UPI00168A71EE|nr:pentapeptide repeat-containing protein [Nostoc sp. FACHB-280]MBD2494233.1 pentapeptide repeat-containing protein [Nostoc sp. FACHB-280]
MALDFSGQNLRGRNFKGQNLAGANFSYADIRGANFNGANLTDANFSNVKAGLQKRWAIGLILILHSLWGLSVYLLSFNIYLISNTDETHITGWVVLVVLIAFYFITILKGFKDASGAFAFVFIGAFAAARTFFMGAFTIVGAFAIAVAFVVVGTIAGAVAAAGYVTLAGIFAIEASFPAVFAIALAIFGYLIATAIAPSHKIAGAIAGVGTLLNIYIAWEAMKRKEKYSLIRNIVIAFTTTGGTSFRNANLTNADFSQAILESTDFRNATLTLTCYHQAKMLDRVRPGKTYLQNSQVRQLLVTGQGQDKNFDRQNLRGINLQSANLADASFIGADLSEANLQDADLSRAKLKQTQLDATDLTGAILTGAFIEDWGITRETKLHGVRCEYIFIRLPTTTNPDPLRKPDNQQEVFQDGDFAEFIQPIFDTLDLYHNQQVAPRAIAIAFNKLAEKHPEAGLEIVAMEKRGDDKLLIRAKTAADVNKSQLSAEYFADYNQLKALSQSQQSLLIEKDDRIRSLETMLTTALNQPKYYIEGDNKVSDISGISIQGSSNVSGIAGGGSVANLGTISGNVNIAINDLPSSPNSEQPGIKELLTQLQAAISQSSELSDEDKAEALEQVKTLAEAGQNPQEPVKQKVAKTAITMLKGLFSGLPAVATLVEAANKLLPVISKLFGLG